MPWTYEQATGILRAPTGTVLNVGYAGHGWGLNNPAMQNVPDVGPIPVGWYTFGAPINTPTDCSIPLIPDDANEMFGRDDFYLHGDLKDAIDHPHQASCGCIVQSPDAVRKAAWASPDHRLQVVSGLTSGVSSTPISSP